jgi:hypothetical protein
MLSILPQPSPAGSDKIAGQGPAGPAAEDVGHWFDLETIVELPAPVANFDDAADSARREASKVRYAHRHRQGAIRRCPG